MISGEIVGAAVAGRLMVYGRRKVMLFGNLFGLIGITL
jgi:hypothetical protein